MSKYKVGDKVVLTVTGTEEAVCHPYYVLNDDNNFNILVSSIDKCAEPLSAYTEPLEAKIRRQAAEITRLLAENKELKEDFEKSKRVNLNMGRVAGQNEAWELAKKGMLMSSTDREVIFGSGCNAMYGVLMYHTYQEAAAKVAEWEKGKEEIKVGDEVKHNKTEYTGIVTRVSERMNKITIIFKDGSSESYDSSMFHKTGRRIDIDSFLKQIGEE